MDTRNLRNCFGHFATGVTVVTWNDDNGNRRGITINSFTSVSLDPPLVLISIDKNTKAYHDLRNRPFIINVLSAEQQSIAFQFAGKQQDGLVVEWQEDSEIGPRLENTVATIECTPWEEYEGGDHLLFLGKVEKFSYSENESLLFHKGKFLKTNANSVMSN
ncbi:flavin reductase family protein [Pseudogracilibacillus sp. SE30717A]|uniref:flavin reductase family protein n=1 Tax=Pseudogracilibacillus sp. SE30717A TaxID=3098293 RepID=UPI00300E3587